MSGSMPDAGTRGMCSLLSGLAIVVGELDGSPTTVCCWVGEVWLSLGLCQSITPCSFPPSLLTNQLILDALTMNGNPGRLFHE